MDSGTNDFAVFTPALYAWEIFVFDFESYTNAILEPLGDSRRKKVSKSAQYGAQTESSIHIVTNGSITIINVS